MLLILMLVHLNSYRYASQWSLLKSDHWYSKISRKYAHEEFRKNFRVSRKTYKLICEKLTVMERKDTRFRKCISLEKRIAIAIYKVFLSAENRTIANLFSVHTATVSKTVREFCSHVIKHFLKDMIKFLTSERDIADVVDGFCNNINFPQYVGAIDGSHI